MTNESKETNAGHTLGPWKVDSVGVITGGYCNLTSIAIVPVIQWANCQIIAGKRGNQDAANWCAENFTESQANAHLIAAAPDLLAALKVAYEHVGSGHIADIKIIEAALAKAEPEEGVQHDDDQDRG